MYRCDDAGQKDEELRRIESYLKGCCETCGGTYPADLHYEPNGTREHNNTVTAVKNEVGRTLRGFLCSAAGKYYLYALASDRAGVSRFSTDSAGNMLADNYASNRYLHMSGAVLRNLLLDNPVVRDNYYELELATRVYRPNDTQKQQWEKLGQHSMFRNNPNISDLYSVRSEDGYISLVSSIAMEQRDAKIDYKLLVQPINYKNRNENDAETPNEQGFLYLADIVCTLFQNALRGSDGAPVSRLYDCANRYTRHADNMIWCYCDLDLALQRAIRDGADGNWFDCLSTLYGFDGEKHPAAAHYRDFWRKKVLLRLRRDCTSERLSRASSGLAALIETTDFNYEQAEAIADELLRMAEARADSVDSACRFNLYHTLMTLSNHRGDHEKAKEYYHLAMRNAQYAPITDYLEMRNAYSVSLLDSLCYQEALENTRKTLEYEEWIEEIRRDIADQTSGRDDTVAVHYSRTLSQLAQCYAYAEQHKEAQDTFEQALARFGDNEPDAQRTRSYLLHELIESGVRERYEQEAKLYFKTDDRLEQLKAACDVNDARSSPFAIWIFVKAWYCLYREETQTDDAKKMLELLDAAWKGGNNRQHPWEFICKYCALIAEAKLLKAPSNLWSGRLKAFPPDVPDGLVARIVHDGLAEYNALKSGGHYTPDAALTFMYR